MPILLEEIFFRHLFSPNNVFFCAKNIFSSHLVIMATGSAYPDRSCWPSLHDPQVNVTRQTEVWPTICLPVSCFHNRKVEKNFNQKLKISKSMTLTLRTLMWVKMVQHKTSDQYLTSGEISIRSIQRFRRYRLLKTYRNFWAFWAMLMPTATSLWLL